MTAKRAHVSDWSRTSPLSESNDNVCYNSDLSNVHNGRILGIKCYELITNDAVSGLGLLNAMAWKMPETL